MSFNFFDSLPLMFRRYKPLRLRALWAKKNLIKCVKTAGWAFASGARAVVPLWVAIVALQLGSVAYGLEAQTEKPATQAQQLQAEKPASLLDPLHMTGSMKTQTRYVVHAVEQLHYLNKPLKALDMDQLVEDYLAELDFNRMFFLKAQVEAYKQRFAPVMVAYLRQQGSLYPGFEMFRQYREQALERIAWVQKRLEQDFDWDSQESYTPDRHEAAWPQTVQEADALWVQRLKYELLLYALAEAEDEALALQDGVSQAEKPPAGPALATAKNAPESPSSQWSAAQRADAHKRLSKRYQQFEEWLRSVDAAEVQEIFLCVLTRMYDPHSTFLSADSLEELSMSIKNALVGMGAILSEEEGYCVVRELLPGGPAERCGQIGPGDKILAVGQEGEPMVDVVGMRLKNVVKRIRGKEGTQVRLLIQPAKDPTARKVVLITREEVKLTAKMAKARVYEVPYHTLKAPADSPQSGQDNTRALQPKTAASQPLPKQTEATVTVGLIELPAFYGSGECDEVENNISRDVEELIAKLKTYGIQGLILDLRRNPGGLFTESVNLAGLFVPAGPIMQAKDTLGQVTTYRDYSSNIAWDGPLLCLVSRNTASSSEIFCGSLQDHRRAIVVGDTFTHGKGTVQGVFEMDRPIFSRSQKGNMGAVKLTIQKWYLPSGSSPQAKGIAADIPLPSVNLHLPIGESDLPRHLPWDSIEPIAWNWEKNLRALRCPVTPELIELLKTQSQKRQAVLPEFAYLNRLIDWLKEKQAQKVFSLNWSQRVAKRDKDQATNHELEQTWQSLRPRALQPVHEVELDVCLQTQQAEAAQLVPQRDGDPEAIKLPSQDPGNQDAKGELTGDDSSPTHTAAPVQKEDKPEGMDIHLQEALRILADWIEWIEQSTVADDVPAQVCDAGGAPTS